MSSKLSNAAATSLFALLIACSSESGDGNGQGGSSNTGNGGASNSNGGMSASNGGSSSSNGGSSSSNGGSTSSNGGASTSNGGSSSSNGGASSTNGGTTSSNGGASTSNGGSSSSNGGSSTANGGATTSNGGTTGSGGAVPTAGSTSMPCPTGCAQLSVPFTAYKAAQQFEIYFADPVDLTTATINVKLRKVAGKAGGVQIIVKDGAPDYQWAQGAWNGINDLTSEFVEKTFVVASPASTDQNHVFDPTKVKVLTVQLNAGDPWYSDEAKTIEDPTALINPTVIQVDEISISGATGTVPGPWTFATATDTEVVKANLDAAGQSATPPWAVAGSTVTWVGP
ncbi:MAG: hypothetical protein ACOY0T_22840 [Myxococcota bacterium]